MLEAGGDVLIAKAGEADDGAARLDGLDDLLRLIACKGETGGVGVDLHCATHRLLCGGGH